MNLKTVLGGGIGEITSQTYRRWFVYQIRASQVILVVSIALLLIGPFTLIFYPLVHSDFMLVGIVLFYIGIMYSQHPGFMRVMPSPLTSVFLTILSLTWAAAYILGFSISTIMALLLVLLYIILIVIKGGIGTKPLYWPNIFFIGGLISFVLAVFMKNTYGLMILPVASIVDLMRRVEGKNKYNYIVDIIYVISLPILTIYINTDIGLAILSLLTLITLGPPPKDNSRFKTIYARAYSIGSLLGRVSLLATAVLAIIRLSFVDVMHLLFLGFIAVIMSSLCIPMLIPGILWFSMKFYGYSGYDIPILIFLASILRVLYAILGLPALDVAMALIFIAYVSVAISYLSGERIKVL